MWGREGIVLQWWPWRQYHCRTSHDPMFADVTSTHPPAPNPPHPTHYTASQPAGKEGGKQPASQVANMAPSRQEA